MNRLLKEIIMLVCCLCFLLLLMGCGDMWYTRFPRFEYQNSSYRFDDDNLVVTLEPGEKLSHSHPYDLEQTDDGYDITFHIVAQDGDGND